MLEMEFDFYSNNLQSFLPKYEGKFVVIKGEKVIGFYDSYLEAINEADYVYRIVTYLVRKVQRPPKVLS